MNYAAEFEKYLKEDGRRDSTILSYVGDIAGFLKYLTTKAVHLMGSLLGFSLPVISST